jgi:hypothetical protein
MLDKDRRWTPWHPDHCDNAATAGMPSKSSAGQHAAWGDQRPGATQQNGLAKGLATAATRQLQGDTPQSSRRLGALLSSDDFRVERRANGKASSVMAAAYEVSWLREPDGVAVCLW